MPATAFLPLAITYLGPMIGALAIGRLIWLLTRPMQIWSRGKFALFIVLGIVLLFGTVIALQWLTGDTMRPGWLKGTAFFSLLLALIVVLTMLLSGIAIRGALASNTLHYGRAGLDALATFVTLILAWILFDTGGWQLDNAPLELAPLDSLKARRSVEFVMLIGLVLSGIVPFLNSEPDAQVPQGSINSIFWVHYLSVFGALYLFGKTFAITIPKPDRLTQFVEHRGDGDGLSDRNEVLLRDVATQIWQADAMAILILLAALILLLLPIASRIDFPVIGHRHKWVLPSLLWTVLSACFLLLYPLSGFMLPAVESTAPFLLSGLLIGATIGLLVPILLRQLPAYLNRAWSPKLLGVLPAPALVLVMIGLIAWIFNLLAQKLVPGDTGVLAQFAVRIALIAFLTIWAMERWSQQTPSGVQT